MLRSWDYHTVWCNSRALHLAGITASSPEPDRGEIPRRADGEPLGAMREWGTVDLITAVMPELSLDARVAALHRATTYYASLGFTWIQNAWVEPDDIDVYVADVYVADVYVAAAAGISWSTACFPGWVSF